MRTDLLAFIAWSLQYIFLSSWNTASIFLQDQTIRPVIKSDQKPRKNDLASKSNTTHITVSVSSNSVERF